MKHLREKLLEKSFSIITVDGTAGSGKGTLAKNLATHFGFQYLDTGAFYRAVAATALAKKQDTKNIATLVFIARNLQQKDLHSQELRTPQITVVASQIAGIQSVRLALMAHQRSFATRGKGLVADGRDVGSVIFPNASLKFFVDADVQVRAKRRCQELRSIVGASVSFVEVLEHVKRRDAQDYNRSISPLIRTSDMHYIDTTRLSVEEMLKSALLKIDRQET